MRHPWTPRFAAAPQEDDAQRVAAVRSARRRAAGALAIELRMRLSSSAGADTGQEFMLVWRSGGPGPGRLRRPSSGWSARMRRSSRPRRVLLWRARFSSITPPTMRTRLCCAEGQGLHGDRSAGIGDAGGGYAVVRRGGGPAAAIAFACVWPRERPAAPGFFRAPSPVSRAFRLRVPSSAVAIPSSKPSRRVARGDRINQNAERAGLSQADESIISHAAPPYDRARAPAGRSTSSTRRFRPSHSTTEATAARQQRDEPDVSSRFDVRVLMCPPTQKDDAMNIVPG